MKKKIIAGNWKMHGTQQSTDALLTSLKASTQPIQYAEIIVFPPYVFLERTRRLLENSNIAWGAQNFYPELQGAFTGEISAPMLRDYGCSYVLVGHSERRRLFDETDEVVARKYQAAIAAGLKPVVCVGEALDERRQGLADTVVRRQLEAILIKGVDLSKALIAYEPVWAIGTGQTASPEMAQEVHAKIRSWVAEFDKTIAQQVRILYGGSVKPDNASALFAMPDIDGGLIGGASLNATDFLDIIQSCCN